MRGRSYGIVLAGVLLSALPWLLIDRQIAGHQADHDHSSSERIRSQLCLALKAAAVALNADPTATPPR